MQYLFKHCNHQFSKSPGATIIPIV